MTGPLEQAGAVREPSEYAALSMDRGITGLWTQRSPLRDADVPYLYGKFYSASRFDSLIDGINREIGADLAYGRRPGSSVYNSNLFPALNSFYPYKRIVSGAEVVRVIVDGMDGVIYDATAGQKTSIFTKSTGAGKARFQSVNDALYFADGVENKKWLQPGTWVENNNIATTQYEIGTLVIDSNGKIEYLAKLGVGNITNVALVANAVQLTFNNTNFLVTNGMSFIPAGLTGASFLNGKLLIAASVAVSGSNFIVTAQYPHAPYASTSDSGTATTTDVGTPATTGTSAPSWSGSTGGTTTDGLSTWINFGVPVFDWGAPDAPANPPSLAQLMGGAPMSFWQPFTAYGGQIIVDSAGNIQQGNSSVVGGVDGVTAGSLPNFNQTPGGSVQDGGVTWRNCGTVNNVWAATFAVPFSSAIGGYVIVDTNGNVQQAVAGGTTGGSVPTWNTAYNASTTDGSVTWENRGPLLSISFKGDLYGYAYHCIDGSVSTMSPLTSSTNGMIDGALLGGVYSTSPQVDSVWIFRTPDGEDTPLYEASIPNNTAGGAWSFEDYYGDFSLNAFLEGPVDEANNPPPIGATAPYFHLGRMWMIYENGVINSGGPNVLTGNGYTAFAPASFFPVTDQPIRLLSTVTNAGPGLLIYCRKNVWIILGDGSTDSPFQQPSRYMDSPGILSYDAITQIGSTFYAFGNAAKVGGKTVGKAFSFDPGSGYTEYGFPIGDQFASVTTGAGGEEPNTGAPVGYLYDPAATFVAWAELGSSDTGLYVADGNYGWFRYSPVASPESGFLWSPRAVINGGTSAIAGIETEPGITQLLMGPPAIFTGIVNVSGMNVSWVSGQKFPAGFAGKTIELNGVPYTVNTVGSGIALTLTASAGTMDDVSYSVNAPAIAANPILFRDSTVNADWTNGAYAAYPSYDVKGCIQLCLSGEVGEIAHVHLVSSAVGARPKVGLLFGEILASTAAPFAWYDRTSPEPPNLPESQSVYSDRYTMLSKGITPKCLFFQIGMDYGTQNYPDKLLMFSVYGAKYAERRQQ